MAGVSVRWNRRSGVIAVLVAFALLTAGVLVAVAVTRGSELPPANSGYTVSIADGLTPTISAARAAAIARHYLDQQTRDLAAPGIHVDPIVRSVSAVRAAAAASLEPGVPAQTVSADPGRVVWVASVTGDFLNLHDLPWSSAGDPYPSGNIVIDDATETILGVYPSSPAP